MEFDSHLCSSKFNFFLLLLLIFLLFFLLFIFSILFRLFIFSILFHLFIFANIEKYAFKLELPGLARNSNFLIFGIGLNKVIEDWHNFESFGIDEELSGFFTDALLDERFECMRVVKFIIKQGFFSVTSSMGLQA